MSDTLTRCAPAGLSVAHVSARFSCRLDGGRLLAYSIARNGVHKANACITERGWVMIMRQGMVLIAGDKARQAAATPSAATHGVRNATMHCAPDAHIMSRASAYKEGNTNV